MNNFNLKKYLAEGKLLKENENPLVIDMEEAEIPTSTLARVNAEVKNVSTMAKAILDFIEQVKEKETVDFESNAGMRAVLKKLNTLAKTGEQEPVAKTGEQEPDIDQKLDEALFGLLSDVKVGEEMRLELEDGRNIKLRKLDKKEGNDVYYEVSSVNKITKNPKFGMETSFHKSKKLKVGDTIFNGYIKKIRAGNGKELNKIKP